MGKKKPKFYTVWVGKTPGVYNTWEECQRQVSGVSGARYCSFPTRGAAEAALAESAEDHWGKGKNKRATAKTPVIDRSELASLGVDMNAWAVDAACKGNPGELEYQGVDLADGVDLFHMGPYPEGTVNIGEFLAIVHAMALLQPTGQTDKVIYSDSRIGISWVRGGRCKTKLPRTRANAKLFNLVDRAEAWLGKYGVANPIMKWETKRWGEIPADFGRK